MLKNPAVFLLRKCFFEESNEQTLSVLSTAKVQKYMTSISPRLTGKQAAFCRQIGMGFSQADAYRTSYDALNMSSASVRREAHRLMKNPNVATMIANLNAAADTKVINDRIADRTEALETLTRMMRGER